MKLCFTSCKLVYSCAKYLPIATFPFVLIEKLFCNKSQFQAAALTCFKCQLPIRFLGC